jgi:transposase InsO family protein
MLEAYEITISMGGRGRWMDNVFIEQLWRSVKYEKIYLKAYGGGRDARAGLADYFVLYNAKHHHQGLDRATPDQVYFKPTAATAGGITRQVIAEKSLRAVQLTGSSSIDDLI